MIKKEYVNICEIRAGDCIEMNGEELTVGKKYITKDDFSISPSNVDGVALYGDDFRLGTILVTRILFPVSFKGELVGYTRNGRDIIE